jgi:hypothetical protein
MNQISNEDTGAPPPYLCRHCSGCYCKGEWKLNRSLLFGIFYAILWIFV